MAEGFKSSDIGAINDGSEYSTAVTSGVAVVCSHTVLSPFIPSGTSVSSISVSLVSCQLSSSKLLLLLK